MASSQSAAVRLAFDRDRGARFIRRCVSCLALAGAVVIVPVAEAQQELWDNGLIYHWNAGRAVSPPGFPDIRVADDFFVEDASWRIHTVSATVLEDAGWDHGGTVSVIVYEDTGDGPGAVFREVTTGFERILTGDQYYGRDEYHYWMRDLDMPVPKGNYWMGIRNPDGGGAGTNYWEGSDRGKDARRSDTGWFSLDAGQTWRREGNCWHHAFQVFGERLGAVEPASFSVSRGERTSGGLLTITDTDDDRMAIRSVRRPASAIGTPGVELTVEGVTAVRNPTEVLFRVEVSPQLVRTPTWIGFFNFRDKRWELAGRDTVGIERECDSGGGPDDVVVANVAKDAARFVDPDTGRVRAKVRFYCPNFSTCSGWTVRIDWVGWAMTDD